MKTLLAVIVACVTLPAIHMINQADEARWQQHILAERRKEQPKTTEIKI